LHWTAAHRFALCCNRPVRASEPCPVFIVSIWQQSLKGTIVDGVSNVNAWNLCPIDLLRPLFLRPRSR
jgi:hypothetical protein